MPKKKASAPAQPFEELTDERSASLKRNYVVKTPIARIGNHKSPKTGRPKKITPTKMRNGINDYFKWCEENDRVPSIKGMMMHIKMERDQFYKYLEYDAYRNMLENARTAISEWVENDIYRTPGQCAGKIAYAKNIHGWADKIDTTSVNENRNTTVLTVEDAKAKIASLAHLINPELLEAVAGRYTLNQIAHQEAEVVNVTP